MITNSIPFNRRNSPAPSPLTHVQTETPPCPGHRARRESASQAPSLPALGRPGSPPSPGSHMLIVSHAAIPGLSLILSTVLLPAGGGGAPSTSLGPSGSIVHRRLSEQVHCHSLHRREH